MLCLSGLVLLLKTTANSLDVVHVGNVLEFGDRFFLEWVLVCPFESFSDVIHFFFFLFKPLLPLLLPLLFIGHCLLLDDGIDVNYFLLLRLPEGECTFPNVHILTLSLPWSKLLLILNFGNGRSKWWWLNVLLEFLFHVCTRLLLHLFLSLSLVGIKVGNFGLWQFLVIAFWWRLILLSHLFYFRTLGLYFFRPLAFNVFVLGAHLRLQNWLILMLTCRNIFSVIYFSLLFFYCITLLLLCWDYWIWLNRNCWDFLWCRLRVREGVCWRELFGHCTFLILGCFQFLHFKQELHLLLQVQIGWYLDERWVLLLAVLDLFLIVVLFIGNFFILLRNLFGLFFFCSCKFRAGSPSVTNIQKRFRQILLTLSVDLRFLFSLLYLCSLIFSRWSGYLWLMAWVKSASASTSAPAFTWIILFTLELFKKELLLYEVSLGHQADWFQGNLWQKKVSRGEVSGASSKLNLQV